jgi:hypothetical protein
MYVDCFMNIISNIYPYEREEEEEEGEGRR